MIEIASRTTERYAFAFLYAFFLCMFRDFVVVFGLVRIGPFLSHRFVCDFSFCVRSWDSILFFSSLRSVVCFDRISVTTCYTHAYALTRLVMKRVWWEFEFLQSHQAPVKRCLLACSCLCVCKHSGTVKVPTVFFSFFLLFDGYWSAAGMQHAHIFRNLYVKIKRNRFKR